MWLCKGSDVSRDSESQYPSTLWRQGQGGVHTTETIYGGWNSDSTAGYMAWLRPPEARDPEARGMVRGGRLGQQDMEEDGDERDGSGDVGIQQEQRKHRRIAREGKRTE